MLDMGNHLKDEATERMLFHGTSYGNANAVVPTLPRADVTCKVPTAVLCPTVREYTELESERERYSASVMRIITSPRL